MKNISLQRTLISAAIIATVYLLSILAVNTIFKLEFGADNARAPTVIMAILFLVSLWTYGFTVLWSQTKARWVQRSLRFLAFMLFFSFSGYGFITITSLTLAGPSIMESQAIRYIDRIQFLDAEVQAKLYDRDLLALRLQLDSDLETLRTEILNPTSPSSCGVGPNAQQKIDTIAEYLPGFYKLTPPGGSLNCNDTARVLKVYQAYEDLANRLFEKADFANSPAQLELAQLRKSVSATRQELTERLAVLLTRLKTLTPYVWVFDDYRIIDDARVIFAKANRDYQHIQDQLAGLPDQFADEKADLQQKVEKTLGGDVFAPLLGFLGALHFCLNAMVLAGNYWPLAVFLVFVGIDRFVSIRYQQMQARYVALRRAAANANIGVGAVRFLLARRPDKTRTYEV